jgi:hypothetical protein
VSLRYFGSQRVESLSVTAFPIYLIRMDWQTRIGGEHILTAPTDGGLPAMAHYSP